MTFPEAYELMQTQWVLCEYNGLLYRRTLECWLVKKPGDRIPTPINQFDVNVINSTWRVYEG